MWNGATDLAVSVFKMTEAACFRFKGDLVNQLRRAALSVANNIAEGFERGTTSELITFLYISRGSAGEVRSMLHFSLRLGEMQDCARQIEALVGACESVSRQLHKWIETLKNGGIEGQRRLTDQSRARFEADRRRAEFDEQLAIWRANLEREANDRAFGQKGDAAVAAPPPAAACPVESPESTPRCPVCGRVMVRRAARDGKAFWGCSGFPQCRGSRSV